MARHEKTLAAIFADPIAANLDWRSIESMLKWLGAEIGEGSGSRVRVELKGHAATFHRPHPRPQASRPLVRAIRVFLIRAGVRP